MHLEDRSPREAYGITLLNLAKRNKNIIVLDADLSKSTCGALIKEHLPDQHFEISIAEQNMISIAVGFALSKKIPFVNSFSVFLTGRAYDQIRVGIALGNLNVKLIGSSAGLSDYGDGATHQSIEDISLMRSLPNMTIIVPSDAVETAKATTEISKFFGPVYMRVNRNIATGVFPKSKKFEIGKAWVLEEGKDLVIFANGVMLSKALLAATKLRDDGISAKIVNISTVKPLDKSAVLEFATKCGAIVVAEEHNIYGGLCSAIAEVISTEKNIVMDTVAIKDIFGRSALSYDEILDYYNLTIDAIVKTSKRVLKKYWD